MNEQALKELATRTRALEPSAEVWSDWMAQLSTYSAQLLREVKTGNAVYAHKTVDPRHEGVPREGSALAAILKEFDELAMHAGFDPMSGRFFGYVPGGGLPVAALGDFIAALTDRYSGIFLASPGAVEIENQTIRWLRDIVAFPKAAWGTLLSGGTLATLTAVVTARGRLPQRDWSKGVLYATEQTHNAIHKSIRVAGIEGATLRAISVDKQYSMNAEALAEQLAADQTAGLKPWMVFATAGTVNTGAVDPLDTIADLCQKFGVWMHVDGAYGGFFCITKTGKKKLNGLARADSVVLDPHKGLFLPYGCGAVLVRDGSELKRTFSFQASYLEDVRDFTNASPSDFSPELTRHFRALRLWFALKLYGLPLFEAALDEKLALAQWAHQRLSAIKALAMGPEPQLSTVTFRAAATDPVDDRPTEQLLARLLAAGKIHLSSTRLEGRLYLRLCVLSFRTHFEEIETAIAQIEEAIAG